MERSDGARLRLAYADPPYPGTANRYYPGAGGEVDHGKLLSLLEPFDGWALSTSEKALRAVLPLCPWGVRVAAWVKPHGVSSKTRGTHNAWEPVIYKPARRRRPGVRDWLRAMPARGGGDLPGRKPVSFCVFLFELLGIEPGDDFVDLFPGSRVVSNAWRQLSPEAEAVMWDCLFCGATVCGDQCACGAEALRDHPGVFRKPGCEALSLLQPADTAIGTLLAARQLGLLRSIAEASPGAGDDAPKRFKRLRAGKGFLPPPSPGDDGDSWTVGKGALRIASIEPSLEALNDNGRGAK